MDCEKTVPNPQKGFTYATALDLNIGYHTIRLDLDVSKICTIILQWGKYSYYDYQWALHVLLTSARLRCLS